MADMRQYLDNAPIDEAITMIDNGVISYAEVLEYMSTPLSDT